MRSIRSDVVAAIASGLGMRSRKIHGSFKLP
jgi:hypothetical protein